MLKKYWTLVVLSFIFLVGNIHYNLLSQISMQSPIETAFWEQLSNGELFMEEPQTGAESMLQYISSPCLSFWESSSMARVARGSYLTEEESGEVALFIERIFEPWRMSFTETIYVVAPFYTRNDDSKPIATFFRETLFYLGLFKIDRQDMSIEHIDSYFLGDRILLGPMESMKPKEIQISFYTHGPKQRMDAKPDQAETRMIKMTENGFEQ